MKTYPGEEIALIMDEKTPENINLHAILEELEIEMNFRDCGNLKEYNQEFMSIFKMHRTEFLLDYSQKDGHFRV
jgi:hypothetical protein